MIQSRWFRVSATPAGVILILLAALTGFATNSSPYTFTGYKWSDVTAVRHVSHITITELSTAYFAGAGDWDATPTRIGVVYTGANPQVHGYNYTSNDGYNGITYPTSSGGIITYAEVWLNWYYLQSASANARRSVAGHEWGHVFGLNHESSQGTNVLMNVGRDRDTTYVPKTDDINGIKALYP